ncbi:hypothetical protein WNZ14_08865 [Hoeflea sp. AS60]|uniref:RidA family protein n=1 Tax=Hoeflea sp. AS60 TaxID=3135780 RepID=UPI00316E15F3
MTAAVSASHSLKAVTLVNTVLKPEGWPAQIGFVTQALQTFRNIHDVLASAGAKHLNRRTWYVTSIDDYLANPKGLGAGCRDVFARCFPAMATIEVVRRVERQAVVEIEPTAARPASDQPYCSGCME